MKGRIAASGVFLILLVAMPSPPTALAEVRYTTDTSLAGGLSAYRIETPSATYVLEKTGGGLASIIDPDGNDWISFDSTPKTRAAGEYRGFPNAVHQQDGNFFHPKNQGTDASSCKVDYAAADRVTIFVESGNRNWAARYDFLPHHCTFTMTRMPRERRYWVLYEGTPGGAYDDDDWWMTSAIGQRQPLTTPHDGSIPEPEWIVFGDRALGRVLFLLHHEADQHPDRFYQMDRQMTVFGFGRQGLAKYLDDVPQSFTIGFLETTDHSEVKQAMHTTVQLVSQALVLAATASATLGGDPSWTRKSSVTGDIPIPNKGSQQTCCVAADLDGDGIEDFVVGERTKKPSIVWYQYVDKRWEKHVIDNTPVKPEAGGVCFDVDADGDPDVVFGQDGSGSDMWWWENPKPDFSKPWKRRLIKQGGSRKHHDQTVGDYDGDGKIEFVSWNQGAKQLLLFEIPNDPRHAERWSSVPIFRWESGRELEGFPSQPVDVDLDGQIDIVGGGRWFKHRGGTKFEAHVIDDKMRFTQCAAGQLVEGGRPEIVFSPGDMDGNAKWFEWNGGKWKPHDLGFVVHGHTCEVGDVNADGNWISLSAKWAAQEQATAPRHISGMETEKASSARRSRPMAREFTRACCPI